PFGRAPKGSLKDTRPDTLGGLVIKEAVARAKIDAAEVEDVVLGCAMPEGEQGLNVARIAALAGGLPVEVPAMTVNRLCSSGLKPAFDPTGTVTAWNSSPLTDGAAAVVVTTGERAKALAEKGVKPLGYLRHFAVAGVAPDVMGLGPIPAVRKVLAKSGMSAQ